MQHAPATDATVIYAETLDVRDWERRYTAGTVPSRWPYGLDLLAEEGLTLSHDRLGGSGKSSTASSTRSNENGAGRPTVTFGFDERVAQAVAAAQGARACGAIWLAEKPVGWRAAITRLRTVRALRKMDVVWCYSSALRGKLVSILKVDDSRVRYVPLGIDTDFYNESPYPTTPMVLSVGNDRSRDSETLYAALAIVHEARPDVRLVVQSNDDTVAPPFIDRVGQFADHAELRENYAAAAVVVIATHDNMYTSGSTVALEVQAVGRPVVITDTPGMDDYVEHGTSGYRAPLGDAASLARHTLELLNDPSSAALMGREGSRRVRTGNSTRTMAKQIAGALTGLSK
jgi:glycosyltransferase involved in cell wall biosynthesis